MVFLTGEKTLFYKKKNKLKPFIRVDVIINCCHGSSGENGALAGLIEMTGITSVSPSVFAGAVTMDKVQCKKYLSKTVNLARQVVVTQDESVGQGAMLAEETFGYPMIVKPNSLGSSIGVKVVKDLRELTVAVMNALRYDTCVLIEEFLQNATEINCAVYRDKNGVVVSECEKPLPSKEFLTFEDKYTGGEREFPANIPTKLSNKIKQITKEVYDKLQTNGVMRFDYLLVDNKIYLNEINSIPGSLAYYLFGNSDEGFREMLNAMIESAKTSANKRCSLIATIDTGVLTKGYGKGAKGK